MSKKSYYFPHDYHARHDPKLERLRIEVGPVTDGIFWDIVEMLYEEGGYLSLKHIPAIAKILNTTEELVNRVVKDSELFSINCEKFYSTTLLARLKHINLKIRKTKASGKLGGIVNAKRLVADTASIRLVKKGNEIKGNNISSSDFFSSLKDNLAYKHINIEIELVKMDTWLSLHPGRQKTKKFIVDWLNKIETPIGPTQPQVRRP